MRKYTRVSSDIVGGLYLSGLTVPEICLELNICRATAYGKLGQAGVWTIGESGYAEKRLPSERISSMYASGMSACAIGKAVGLTVSKVTGRLRKLGVALENRTFRRYSCNDAFFGRMDAETIYWAGFLAADGCIDGNMVKVELAIKDIGHLRKLRKSLGFTGKIKTSTKNGKKYARMAVTSSGLVRDLERNFNVVPRKSLVLNPPGNIPDHMAGHFVRGYMDGDGCVYCRKPSVSFVGTKSMLSWIRSAVASHCPFAGRPGITQVKGKRVFRLGFEGRFQSAGILEWIFSRSDSDTRLSRKFTLAKKVMAMPDPRRPGKLVASIKSMWLSGSTFGDIRKATGVGYCKARAILTENGISVSRW
jgi:hypothetical protein